MQPSQRPGITNITAPDEIYSLGGLLSPELIQEDLTLTDTVSLRKRKLPLKSMVWLVVGMSLFSNKPLSYIINLMDIVDRAGKPLEKTLFVSCSTSLSKNATRRLVDVAVLYNHRWKLSNINRSPATGNHANLVNNLMKMSYILLHLNPRCLLSSGCIWIFPMNQ